MPPDLAPAAELPKPGPRLSAVAFHPGILQRRPRILIDITPTARLPPFTGGIARVARELGKAGVTTGLALPVYIDNGVLHPYYRHALLQGPITLARDDIYVVADVFWFFLPEYRLVVEQVRAVGARVALIVHDIGAIRFPGLFREDMPALFRAGLLELLRQSAFCIGVSRHVERDTRAYLDEVGFPAWQSLRFGHFLLGVGKAPLGDARLRATVTEPFGGGRTFLGVGTLEPRKGYDITLDACELAWECGAEFVFVLIGRYGWSADALRGRIEAHPELNRRLFWIQDATDAELAYAYAHCRSLIQSSFDEGFCLPVSEACLFGAAVITSDLPAIREIAGSSVRYYRAGSCEQLARHMHSALAAPPQPARFPLRSWNDAVQGLAACLADPAAPGQLPAPMIARDVGGPIHVACCFDDAMAMPAGVLAASVSDTTRDMPVVFHMVRPPGLATELGALREALETPRFRLIEHIANADTSGLHCTGHYSSAVYYRLMLPDLIDAERVVYLDSDTMVRRSLSGLWEADLQGHPIASTVDYLDLTHRNGDGIPVSHGGELMTVEAYCRDVVGIDLATTSYFNSGVMVMDLAAWRRRDLAARCRAECTASRALTFVDQDAANAILQGDFLPLDQRWNAFLFLAKEYWPAAESDRPSVLGQYQATLCPPSGDLLAALKAWADDPWIVHFAHRSKPWRAGDLRTDFDEEFWQHAFRTPFGSKLRRQFLQLTAA